MLEQSEALADLEKDARSEDARPLLRELGEATLALLRATDENLQRLSAVDRQFDFELIGCLLGVPARLAEARQTDLAVRVAEALRFCAPDDMNGEIALAFARAGDRERALARVLTNLETAIEPVTAEYKAGDVYRELGEADAAEAYYRRSLALAKTASERTEGHAAHHQPDDRQPSRSRRSRVRGAATRGQHPAGGRPNTATVGRTKRSLPVRQRQEVQEVSRRLTLEAALSHASRRWPSRPALARIPCPPAAVHAVLGRFG